MSVPFTQVAQNSNQSWTFTWLAVAGAPYYRIVFWGREIDRTTLLNYTYANSNYINYPAPLEIVAGDAKTLSETYPPFVLLQWYDESCSYFTTYQFDGTNWNVVKQISEGGWVYTFDTGTLVDETSYVYGVSATDTIGNESGREEYDLLMVCSPVPPDGKVVLSYVFSGHQVQIAAAP